MAGCHSFLHYGVFDTIAVGFLILPWSTEEGKCLGDDGKCRLKLDHKKAPLVSVEG